MYYRNVIPNRIQRKVLHNPATPTGALSPEQQHGHRNFASGLHNELPVRIIRYVSSAEYLRYHPIRGSEASVMCALIDCFLLNLRLFCHSYSWC